MQRASLEGFFSTHADADDVVRIQMEPKTIYWEELRNRLGLSFDFILENLEQENLDVRFIKVAAYDAADNLLTYRYVNGNAIGPSGIDTLGATSIPAGETIDLYNPFHEWSADLPISRLRFTFTFRGEDSGREIYIGNVDVRPHRFIQQAALRVPMRGLITVLDAHDHLSHHRRFAMSRVRQVTGGAFAVNFCRFGFDLALLGEDGNLAQMSPEEFCANHDFHHTDIRRSYTDGAPVYAPASGVIVEAVDDLEDMYDAPFDTDRAIQEGRIRDIAGNRVIIRHNEREYSHLYHFKRRGLVVSTGEPVEEGQLLGAIGFSGTATVYSHLHYQLMDGADFMHAQALPVRFSDVTLVRGQKQVHVARLAPETGDFLQA